MRRDRPTGCRARRDSSLRVVCSDTRADERASQLDGVGHIVVDELVGEVEHVACGELRLAVSRSSSQSVPSKYRYPPIISSASGFHTMSLLVAVRAGVELVDVHRLAGARRPLRGMLSSRSRPSLCITLGALCAVMMYISLLLLLVTRSWRSRGVSSLSEQLFAYRFNDWFFHLCVVIFLLSLLSGWLLGGALFGGA